LGLLKVFEIKKGAGVMKKKMPSKKETNVYQCCICEDESEEFQVCCGHPMMIVQSEQEEILDL